MLCMHVPGHIAVLAARYCHGVKYLVYNDVSYLVLVPYIHPILLCWETLRLVHFPVPSSED